MVNMHVDCLLSFCRDGDYESIFTDLTQFPEVLKKKQVKYLNVIVMFSWLLYTMQPCIVSSPTYSIILLIKKGSYYTGIGTWGGGG